MKKLIILILIILIPATSFAGRWFGQEYGFYSRNDRYNPDYIEAYIKMLDDKDPVKRRYAVRHLGVIDGGVYHITDKLKNMSTNDPDEDVRELSAIAMKKMNDSARGSITRGMVWLDLNGKKVGLAIRPQQVIFNGTRNLNPYRANSLQPVYFVLMTEGNQFTISKEYFEFIDPSGKSFSAMSFDQAYLFVKQRGSSNSEQNRLTMDFMKTKYFSQDNPDSAASKRGFILFSVPRGITSFADWIIRIGLKDKEGTIYLVEASQGKATVIDTIKPAAAATVTNDNIEDKIRKLNELLNKGLITKQEYNDKRKELLNAF